MVGPDEGGPQTRDGRVGRAAVRLQRGVHAGQPFGRFAHARDCVDTGAGHACGPAEEDRPAGARLRRGSAETAPGPPPDQRALLVTGEPGHPEERWIDAEAAEAAGYTLLDLARRLDAVHLRRADHDADGQPLPNRYRRVFLGLANDQLDEDGEPLEPGGKNYLELYGIPPSLSVLRARFVEDEAAPLPRPGERRGAGGGRDGHLRRAHGHARRTSAGWRRCARSWRRRAARRGSRRWRSSPRSSRRWRPR